MANMGRVKAELDLNTKKFDSKLDKSRRQMQTFGQKGAEGFNKIGAAVGKLNMMLGGFGAALSIGAIVAFSRHAVQAAKDIQNLSRLAGVGAEEFQRHAFAARQVGVEQEKLADIYKDVNDKMGDFIITGQGPLVDFFETVGKKVGVTAEAFKGLTGPQILEKYVSTLQQANVDQQQMTFFMEAIASDATLLVPLFENNAEALKNMGAEATGVLSDETVQKGNELTIAMQEMASAVGGSLTSAFIDATHAAGGFFGLVGRKALEQDLEDLNEQIVRLEEDLATGVKRQGGSKFGGALGIGPEGIRAGQLSQGEQEANYKALNELLAAREAILAKIDLLENPAAKAESSGANVQTEKDRLAAEKVAADEATEAQRLLNEQYKLNEDARGAAQKAEADALSKEWEAQQESLATFEALVEERRKYGTTLTEEQKVLVEIGELMEQYPEHLGMLQEMYALQAEKMAETTDKVEKATDQMSEFGKAAAENMQDAFADFLFDPFNDGLDGMLANFAKTLQKMAAEMASQKILTALFSGLAGSSNSFLSGIGKAFTPSGKAGGGIIQPGRMELVGERGPELIMPNAPARVVNNHTMGQMGGSKNIVVRIENSGTPQKAVGSTATHSMDEMIITVLTKDLQKGGRLDSTIRNQYGLRRQG